MKGQLPLGRWVLHAAPRLGGVTDRWIDLQARLSERYETRLIGARTADGATPSPSWIRADEHYDLRLAYNWLDRSRGLSSAWIARYFRRRAPALVHAHYGTFAAQHEPFARRLGIPLVASFYGFDATKTVYATQRRWSRQYERLFARVAAVVVEGPAMGRRVESLGCPPSKIHVVRLPADADGLEGCRRPKVDSFVVVAAGRFVEKKGFDTAISAFAQALRGEDARLLVLGGGPLERSLKELAVAEGIQDQVTWGGRLPFHEFMGAVSTAHVGLYPSRTAADGDSEGGAPVTLIEAQWLGVPSLVSDHDDLPFVAAEDGSIVLPARETRGWAEALETLFEDRSRLAGMATRAEEFARTHNAPARNLAEREAVYSAIV